MQKKILLIIYLIVCLVLLSFSYSRATERLADRRVNMGEGEGIKTNTGFTISLVSECY